MAEKRYYWLKLPKDFFQSKEIKRLRRIAGGDTYTIIYLKMLLKSLETNGRLYFEGIEDNFSEEIALDIDEEPDNVQVTMDFLKAKGLMTVSDDEAFLEKLPFMVGSESESAERVRRFRDRQKDKALHCNATPLLGNDDVTIRKRSGNVEKENREKRIESELDTELEIEKDPEIEKENTCSELPKRKPSQKQENVIYADVYPVILNDKTEWRPDIDTYHEYQELYPSVNVDYEFRAMNRWCKDNPAKRKTIRGVKRFVSGWLSRQQDKPRKSSQKFDVNDFLTEQLRGMG